MRLQSAQGLVAPPVDTVAIRVRARTRARARAKITITCVLGISARVRTRDHRALLVQGAADGAVQGRHDVVAEVAPQPARRRAGMLLHQITADASAKQQ